MIFEVSAELEYEALSPSTLFLNILPFKSEYQEIIQETFLAYPENKTTELLFPVGEKRLKRIEIFENGKVKFHYKAEVKSEVKILAADLLTDVMISQMPVSVLPYLNPSRYCQSDKLYKLAFDQFGKYEHAFEKVTAICDWIYNNVEYNGAGYTSAQTSAFDTLTQRIGVCRDFAHLGIALCRAVTIPARYFTGYAYQLQPADFHACFEVYLGGHWIVFDATRLAPLNGMIKIATGSDAAETPFASSFGNLQFLNMKVCTNLLEGDFQPIKYNTLEQGCSYS